MVSTVSHFNEKTNKFFINAEASKKRLTDFIKNICTVRHTFMQLFGVDLDIILPDQMLLHHNKFSGQSSMNFKGAAQAMSKKTILFPDHSDDISTIRKTIICP